MSAISGRSGLVHASDIKYGNVDTNQIESDSSDNEMAQNKARENYHG